MTEPNLIVLDASWTSIEASIAMIAESPSDKPSERELGRLRGLRLVEPSGDAPKLSRLGERYYMARFVHQDEAATREVLMEVLRRLPVVTAFCAAMWGRGPRPVAGALRLIRQITKSSQDVANRRWLALMNSAGLIVYNQKNPTLRVLYNPYELSSEEPGNVREESSGHVVAPDTPFSNRLALRNVIRAAREWLWWYEQHLPPKVLEVLVGELDGSKVAEVRFLSGPANVTADLKTDFVHFAKEMKAVRGIDVHWRVLARAEAQAHHDRFILSKDLAMNVPPLSTLLMGSTSEILPSKMSRDDFAAWWELGMDLAAYVIEPAKAPIATTRVATRQPGRPQEP